MTLRLSRRTFLGAAAATAWHAAGRPSQAEDNGGLCLLIHDAEVADENFADGTAGVGASMPTLLVSDRTLSDTKHLAVLAQVSWQAVEHLSAEQLAFLLAKPGPVRVASASGHYQARGRATWTRLGRLVVQQTSIRQVIADLGGGAGASAEGSLEGAIEAFRKGLGPDAASRLAVRHARRPNRYG